MVATTALMVASSHCIIQVIARFINIARKAVHIATLWALIATIATAVFLQVIFIICVCHCC